MKYLYICREVKNKMPLINNRKRTMLESLKNSLHQAERIDILTAFFYFSGFNELAEELKDKKIRILVGKSVDSKRVDELRKYVKEDPEEELDTYGVGGWRRLNNSQKKEQYIESFINMFNKSPLSEEFDSSNGQSVFKMFLNKIKDGTLEIRLTNNPNHSKAYIITNKQEHSCNGDQKGVVFMGSSNFTYNGLLGQGELNQDFRDNDSYNEYLSEFESMWNDSKSIDICVRGGNNDFEKELKDNLWIFAKPTPYQIFIRILYEMYNSVEESDIKTPSEITNNKFCDFKYQRDAIKYGVDCINRNNGVIIADVVGLGKSIIASAIANNLDINKTVIIAPPHLKDQWEKYQQDFGIRGCKVWSSGKIAEEIYNTYSEDPDPILYIIDEAHRYRNELSETYQKLHQLTRSNAKNKVILLTATPYNNRPQDLFALIKLFQTPSRSTINSVNNLSVKFSQLTSEYKRLERENKKYEDNNVLKPQFEKLSKELRTLIDPVMIRRSRIDLKNIKEYQKDLELQNIKFPEVVGPNLIEYDLGSVRELYISTLKKLEEQFKCARYSPTSYLIDTKKFNQKYGALFSEKDIEQAQKNLAKFMQRLLVMRFESSKSAFKSTLLSLLDSCKNIKLWWKKTGYVPIKKSGYLQNPDDVEVQEMVDKIDDIINGELDAGELSKKDAIPIPKEMFREEFIEDVESDIGVLTDIYEEWFKNGSVDSDPKYDRVKEELSALIREDKNRKIVVFSSFADTAEYVYKKLKNDGFRVMLYTGDSSNSERSLVTKNFDASCSASLQRNDFDVIVATDALSEGFNLNRAGIIVNYDIPYNPTRVVQRIGRINRINKKMFDKIYIFNFFPTDIGEDTTSIKKISTLKMFLINNIVGSDTRTLTPNEDLRSYFKKSYKEADEQNNLPSWDVKYKNIYDDLKNDKEFIDTVLDIPERVRIVRKTNCKSGSVLFAKRGSNTLFGAMLDNTTAKVVSPEIALKLFEASPEEEGFECDEELDRKFALIRDEIKKPFDMMSSDSSRRTKAIDNLEYLKNNLPNEKDYIDDLLEVIKEYDDLSDGELKYLANVRILPQNLSDILREIKQRISTHYINQIKQRAEYINSEPETILFNEDIRNVAD